MQRVFEADARSAAANVVGPSEGKCPFSGLSAPGLPAAILVEPVQARASARCCVQQPRSLPRVDR